MVVGVLGSGLRGHDGGSGDACENGDRCDADPKLSPEPAFHRVLPRLPTTTTSGYQMDILCLQVIKATIAWSKRPLNQ